MNTRATTDTGAAGLVMPVEMFPQVKQDRTSATKNSLQQMGQGLKIWVRKPCHLSPLKECTGAYKFRSCKSACEALDLNEKRSCKLAMSLLLDEENIRTFEQSRWHSHQAVREERGVHHGHVGVSMKLVQFWAGTDSEWLECRKVTVRPGTNCSSEGEESCAEQELDGLEEQMKEEEELKEKELKEKAKQEQETGECEQAQERLHEKVKNTMPHRCRSAIGAHTASWVEVALITTCQRKKKKGDNLSERPTIVMDYCFVKPNSTVVTKKSQLKKRNRAGDNRVQISCSCELQPRGHVGGCFQTDWSKTQ